MIYSKYPSQWFAYLHVAGTIVVKQYINEEDLEEVRGSSFIKYITEPFSAFDRSEAERIAHDIIEKANEL